MSSTQLSSGANVLDGNLGGAWDLLSGSAGENPRLGIGRRYGGASGAYSLRDIGAEGGAVVNVTRSSDSERRDFSAVQVADGTLEAFIGAGNNGTVFKWYDQSGSGKNLEAGTDVTKEPIIVSNGSLITDNGKPAIFCDGGQFLTIPGSATVEAKAFYLVLNVTSGDPEVPRDIMGMRSGSVHFMRFNSSDGEQVKWNGNGHIFGTTAEDQQIIISVDIDSSNDLRYFEDGSQSGNTKTGSTGNFKMQRFFMRVTNGAERFKGKAQEAIFFDTDLSAERTDITNEINAYYGAF
jgi:hypothetical protein